MNRRNYVNDNILHIVLMLLCLVPLLVAFILTTDANNVFFRFNLPILSDLLKLPCIFKAATGLNCPACGMTRCFIFMSRLDIAGAWSMNKAGVLLWFFCVFQVFYTSLLLIGARIPMKKFLQAFQPGYLIIFGIVLIYDFIVQFL